MLWESCTSVSCTRGLPAGMLAKISAKRRQPCLDCCLISLQQQRMVDHSQTSACKLQHYCCRQAWMISTSVLWLSHESSAHKTVGRVHSPSLYSLPICTKNEGIRLQFQVASFAMSRQSFIYSNWLVASWPFRFKHSHSLSCPVASTFCSYVKLQTRQLGTCFYSIVWNCYDHKDWRLREWLGREVHQGDVMHFWTTLSIFILGPVPATMVVRAPCNKLV